MKSSTQISDWSRWWIVAVYATAMAWVESAVVVYLRTLVHRLEPYQPNPLPVMGGLASIEMIREFATLVMLLTVGVLAGRTWRARIGYAVMAFGIWDIFYYVFLKCMCGWPHSLLDWDILFLLPLPWWGPVLTPVLISLLMIAWGTAASQFEPERVLRVRISRWWWVNLIGTTLALYVFMADAITATSHGPNAVRAVLPVKFNWPGYWLALLLMAAPLLAVGTRLLERFRVKPAVGAATRNFNTSPR